MERTASKGQDPRQEEGIPSPSLQSCSVRSEARELPCTHSQPHSHEGVEPPVSRV